MLLFLLEAGYYVIPQAERKTAKTSLSWLAGLV